MGNLVVTIYNAELYRRRKMVEKETKTTNCLASNTSNIITKTTTVCDDNDESHKNDWKTWKDLNTGSGKHFYVDKNAQIRRDSWDTANERARKRWLEDQGRGSWNENDKTPGPDVNGSTKGRRHSLFARIHIDQDFDLSQHCQTIATNACVIMSHTINKHWEKLEPAQNIGNSWNIVSKDATKHWNKEGRALIQREVWNNINRNATKHWNFEGHNLNKMDLMGFSAR
eukprot:GFUD01030595.1.p1 GENE.GFUD01030595.1~~GFUD01030595.1.p1  ORF type:complete len:227 (-),score=61.28 GFUD01030595.1:65-745(-)